MLDVNAPTTVKQTPQIAGGYAVVWGVSASSILSKMGYKQTVKTLIRYIMV